MPIHGVRNLGIISSYYTNSGSVLLNSSGVDGRVTIPHVSAINSLAQITIEMWVKRVSNGSSNFPVIATKTDISADWTLIYRNETSELSFRHEFSTTQGEWACPIPPDNIWYHVAVTFDSSSLSNTPIFYINGVSQASVTRVVASPTGTPVYGSGPIELGNRIAVRDYVGYLDEVRYWNSIRSPQQILDNMFKVIQGSTPNLAVYLRFEESSGTTVTDLTGNSNGTISGNASLSTDTPFFKAS
jgi:hypothetical protein